MTRDNFMNELGKALHSAPLSEREQVLNFYTEYFEDRGIHATDLVPSDLASPRAIADEILQNIPYSQTQAASDVKYSLLPISIVETLEIKLKIAGFELEVADIPHPELKLPHNKYGQNLDYRIDFTVSGTHLRIVDEAPGDVFSKWNRINIDPVVLRLPKNTRLMRADIDLSMGSTKIYDLQAANLYLRNAMGAVKLIGGTIGNLDAELKMGSFQLDKSVIHASKISVSMGDLRGKTTLLGEHHLKCDMGSIKLDLNQALSETTYQTQVSLGSFRVNSVRSELNGIQHTTTPSSRLFLIVSMGSISLDFAE